MVSGEAYLDPLPCPLTPQQEEGPYYWQLPLERQEITEGRPGTPLQLLIKVVDAECTPISGASVDIWHCDASGCYSWYAADEEGEELSTPNPASRGCEGAGVAPGTFLRGWQPSGQDGTCRFETIYPGWYPGRAVHIHVKVHHDGNVLTTQLYFPDELTDVVHRGGPYGVRPVRDTRNEDDVIYRQGGEATLLQPAAQNGGYTAEVTLAVG